MNRSRKKVFEICASAAFILFVISIAFLAFCYGIAQLYEIQQKWVCSDNDKTECLHYLNDGTIMSLPTTVNSIDISVWHPTPIGIIYFILFFIVGFSFIALIIFFIVSSFKTNNSQFKYKNANCCRSFMKKLTSVVPNRYNTKYSSFLWLILLQLKRCIFESLYLLQKGGINVLYLSQSIGVSNRVETKQKVLVFAILLGSNCIFTSFLYSFWWIYFRFSSLSFVITIVFIESVYDVFFSLFPILSNNFEFGYMNFLDDVTNFITTFFPLLYLLYSLQNSMKYILPFISNKRHKISAIINLDIQQPNALEIAFLNKSNDDINTSESALTRNDSANSSLHIKKKYTIIFFIIFFLSLGCFIIIGTAMHLHKSETFCSTDIVQHWSSYYTNGCRVKLYPFFRHYPCDCRTFEMNTLESSETLLSEATIQFGFEQFHHAQFIGIDSSKNTALHFTPNMYVSNVLQVLNIDGFRTYLLDKFDSWPYLQILSIKIVLSLSNNASSLGALKHLESINFHGSSSIKFLSDTFCKLESLKYFNCNGCLLYELPSCFGNGLSNLITLQLNYNANLQYFPATFPKLKNTLHALYCYECSSLYKNSNFPLYFLNFTHISFMELILFGTPTCNNINNQVLEMRQYLNDSFSCFEGCGDACFPHAITSCGSQCNVSDCNYGFGYCLEPECSDYNASNYHLKMKDIHLNNYCDLQYNTSQCQYGFGNCITYNINNTDRDICDVKAPFLFNKTLQCGTKCKASWLNEGNWCDTSCENYANGINGNECPYPYESNACYSCHGYCDSYQTVWQTGFLRSTCNWISGCYLVRFALPNVELLVGQNYLKEFKSNESFTEWWYNITNNSVSLMEPLNYQQTLYYLGPYLEPKQFAECWNYDISYSRIDQISCQKCFGDAWNEDVSVHKVNGTCQQTTVDDWNCNV